MSTESASSPVQSAVDTKKKKRTKTKLLVLFGLVLVVVLAAQTGLLGFGVAHLRAATFPRDESLLEYVPGSVRGVLVIDPHQIVSKELGDEGSVVRDRLDRVRDDLKAATGINLAFDVDKLVIAPSLVVARGRFDAQKLAERLAERNYTQAEHKGTKYLLRANEDAIAVLDGSIVLYGGEAEIRGGIDAEEAGTSLASNEELTSRLSEIGWDHPLLAVAQMSDSKPSLRSILTGSTGPRGVALGLTMKSGLIVDVIVDAASVEAAEELHKLLEEKRNDQEALKAFIGQDLGASIAEIAKRAKLSVDSKAARLRIQADVSPAELDGIMKASEKAASMFGALSRDVRIFQLLAPSL